MGDFRNVQEAIEGFNLKALTPAGNTAPLTMDSLGGLLTSSPLFDTGLIPINVANTAYTADDAFGPKLTIHVPPRGTITQAFLYDLDDEGVQVDVVLFEGDFTATADDAAFAVSDDDMKKCCGVITISSYANCGGFQLGQAFPLIAYHIPTGLLRAQCIVRGTPTVAAGPEPYLRLWVQWAMTVRTIQRSAAEVSTQRITGQQGFTYQNIVQAAADVALNDGRQARLLWRFGDEVTASAIEALAMQTYYNPSGASTATLECIDATIISEGASHTGLLQTITAAIGKTGASTNATASAFTSWAAYAITAGTITSLYGFRALGTASLTGGTITTMYGFYSDEITRAVGTAGAAAFVQPSGGGTDIGVILAKGATSGKPTLWIQDNVSAFVIIQCTDGTTTWTWSLPPDDGDAGEQLQTNGSGVTTWEAAASVREVKDTSGVFAPEEALRRIVHTPVERWHYKPSAKHVGGDYTTEFVGVVADNAPWAMMHNGRVFNPINAFGHAAAAIQALAAKVEALEAKVA